MKGTLSRVAGPIFCRTVLSAERMVIVPGRVKLDLFGIRELLNPSPPRDFSPSDTSRPDRQNERYP